VAEGRPGGGGGGDDGGTHPSCSRGACGRDRRRHIADAASSFLRPIDRGNYRRRLLAADA